MRQLYYRVMIKDHNDQILESYDFEAPDLADCLDFLVWEKYREQRIKNDYIHFDLVPYWG